MAVNISTASRLRFAELLIIDDVTFWDIVDLPTFVTRKTDLFHRVESTDRIDTLSKTFYRDERFWWVIAWANDLEILPTDLNENAILIIPDPEFVRSSFFPRTR